MSTDQIRNFQSIGKKSHQLRKSIEALLEEFEKAVEGDKVNVLQMQSMAEHEVEGWLTATALMHEKLKTSLQILTKKAADQRVIYEIELRKSLENHGMEVFGESGLLIVDGFVHIVIKLNKVEVSLNGKRLDDINIISIVTKTIEELETLKRIITPPEIFLKQLLIAYNKEIDEQGRSYGTEIQISQLLWRIALLRQDQKFKLNPTAAKFKEYPVELFRADLAQLLKSSIMEVDGFCVKYSSGSTTVGSIFMFVPALGRVAHIGRIRFEHV